jgi:hypothetical protein
MRYFYTWPLAAAWMAKHFGMEFETNLYISDWCAAIVTQMEFGSVQEKYYIHPDSLHLLEPQKNDIICIRDGDSISYGKWHSGNNTKDVRIIERNGSVFMWPKSED